MALPGEPVTSSLPDLEPGVAALDTPSQAAPPPAAAAIERAAAVPTPRFLLAVDLEDIRILIPDGLGYRERVPDATHSILEALARYDARITFFTTGDVARRHPELVREIFDGGHEIGCHGDLHVPLDRQTPASLHGDISRCLESYEAAGVPADRVKGYRAPMGSLVASTRWGYSVLRERGFTYSSSVCATSQSLYAWPEFGPDLPREVDGVWEVPITLAGLPGLNMPLGGIHFRVLPFVLTRALLRRKLARRGFVATYVHPYDVDTEQERFMHPEIGESRFYNWLMYLNRHRVIPRFESFLAAGFQAMPMGRWVDETLRSEAA